MAGRSSRTPFPVAGWIILCAYLNCAGWGLSAIHELNAVGYAAALLIGLAAVAVWWRRGGPGRLAAFGPRKLMRRFRRPFALAFLVLGSLAILGGVIHAPNNYDGLAYRTPRVLNWLAEGRWHWIHTEFQRLNTRTCGFEWVTTPLILFTRTDRLEFLINAFSFLLLPGLVFSLFRHAGVKGRTAWHWMWLLPTGYGYLLEAGSSANDLFGVVFAVAAVDCALRARQAGRMGEVWLSVLAAAMFTSAKASNLPLLLPWLAAMAAAWRVWLWRPLALGAVVLPALGASFVPTAALNWEYGRDWTGASIEHVSFGGGPVWLHVFNNGFLYALENLAPPVFPFTAQWNGEMDRVIPPSLAELLQKNFDAPAAHWQLGELRSEESAGLGIGVTTLLLASLVAGVRGRKRAARAPPDWLRRLMLWAPWLSLVYTMAKMSLAGGARYLSPYNPLLMMGLLTGEAQSRLTARKWWRVWAGAGFTLALLLVVVSQARPLWPAGWFFEHYGARLQSSTLGTRVTTVYQVYGARPYAFAPAVKLLPADARVVGIMTSDDPETSLWRPFGSRRILHVLAQETGAEIRRRGIQYTLVRVDLLKETWADWLRRVDARELGSVDLRLRAGSPAFEWRLAELNRPTTGLAGK